MAAIMGPAGATSLAISALALLWLGIAVAIAVAAARRYRIAQQVLEAAQANARLLELTPARPMLVRSDDGVEVDQQLVRDLGLEKLPSKLWDLVGNDSGIAPADLEVLVSEMGIARASATRVALKLRAHGSGRVFDVRGGPAPDQPPGTLLLWFFDTSAGEEERAKLSLRLKQTEAALGSLTQLIEAAPFPMWYRGPDLKLGLVNSAFVHAVEGKDAADVMTAPPSWWTRRGRTVPSRSPGRRRKAAASSRACSRRSSMASGACCGSPTCRFRPAPSRGSRSTSKIWKTPAPSLPATSNRSASSPTA